MIVAGEIGATFLLSPRAHMMVSKNQRSFSWGPEKKDYGKFRSLLASPS